MAQPEFVLEADWDRDGVFTEFTADVAEFNMGRGKEEAKEETRAGFMDLTVNNHDHKYTPTKSTSVLFPFVRPGVPMRSWLVYPYDALDDAGTASLNGRTVPNDSDFGTWAADAGFVFDGSNLIENTNTAAEEIAVADFGESDVWVGAKVVRGPHSNDYSGGIVARYVDDDNLVMIVLVNTLDEDELTQVSVLVKSEGVWATENFGFLFNSMPEADRPAVGETFLLSARCFGKYINVYVNNYLLVPFADLTGYASSLLTATKFGIGAFEVVAEDRWTRFGGWKPLLEGRIDHVEPRPGTRTNYAYLRAFDDLERAKRYQVYRLAPTPPQGPAAIIGKILAAMDVHFGKGGETADGGNLNGIIKEGDNLSTDPTNEKVMGRNGLTELQQVADDDVGFVYADGANVYHYEPAGFREEEPFLSPRATWEAERAEPFTVDDKYFQEPLTWDDGKDLVENEIYYEYYTITIATNQEVWKLPEHSDSVADNNPEFTANETPNPGTGETDILTFLAIGNGDQLANPRIPKPGTDFTVNGAANGAGVDQTASLESEIGTVSIRTSDFTLDDTGQDFTTAGGTIDGVGFVVRGHAVFIEDASANRAVAFLAFDDPDTDGTRVSLLTAPPGWDASESGYAGVEDDFDETDTPLTYDVYLFAAWFREGLDGNFKQINLQGTSQFVSVANGGSGSGTTSDGSFLNLLRLMADKGTNSVKVAARAESSLSQNDNGRRRIQHEALHIDRWETALDRAKTRLRHRAPARERLGVTMIAGSKGNLMELVHRELSDMIAVNFTDMGLDNRNYYIDRYQITAGLHSGGKPLEAKFGLTSAVLNPGWGNIKWGEFFWSWS